MSGEREKEKERVEIEKKRAGRGNRGCVADKGWASG